jgi:GntR family phosphonate transport system transcriptional regulator
MKTATVTQQPVYRQVSQALEKLICDNCALGDYLPSENRLAAQFQVNRHTVRRAIDELVTAGLIARKQGKGSQIINNRIDYSLTSGRFTATLDKLRRKTQSDVIKEDVIEATEKIAAYLNIDVGSRVIVLDTLRFVDGFPISIITHYLNPMYVPNINKHYTSGSLHECIENMYGLTLCRSEALISAVMPSRDESFLLKVPLSTPLLKIKSFNSVADKKDAVVEVSISRSRADRFQIQVPTIGVEHECR